MAKKKAKKPSAKPKKKATAKKKVTPKPKKRPVAKKPLKKKVKAKAAPRKPAARKKVTSSPAKRAKILGKKPAAASKPVRKAPAVVHQGLTGAMPLAVVTHYYDRIGVATLKLMGTMRMGDRIRVTRGDVSFDQAVHSLQIAGNPVQGAISGQDVAMKLDQPAHEGARVYKA